MKVLTISLLLLLTLTNYIKAQSPIFVNDKAAFQKSQHFLQKSIFTESKNHAKTDFIYQHLEWEIDPAVRYISGKIATTFKSKTANLSSIEFDFSEALIVDSIIQDNTKLDYTRTSDKLLVSLQATLTENQIDSLTIYYQGVPPKTGFGSFTTSTHGNEKTPALWTLSEPYGAKEWWPCKQSLTDKIDSIDVIVTTPEMYRTASNGIMISETINAGKRTMHWKHRFPIATYLVAIAVTNYKSYSDYLTLDDGRTIEILNYVYPENFETAKTETPVTADLIELFNTLVGEYPFANEKYGHAQFGWGGGMEHQTMSFMAYFDFGLIAHELAHQWFGDYITLGTWQDIWLNEGFATYLTGIAHEHLLPEWWGPWKESYKNSVLSQAGGSVFVEDTTSISRLFSSRLSYAKGGYILHMQRWILGDDVFFSALKNYFTDDKVANGFAYSEDWIRHIETAGDTTLTEFFNDWLYGEGYPIYSATYQQHNTDSLTLKLWQSTSHNSVDFFELPVPIRVYNNNKTDSADFRLNNTINNQEFTLNPGFVVAEIIIDPENWIVCKTETITAVPTTSTSNKRFIYPNPTTNEVNILIPENEQLFQVMVFSSDGKLLQKFSNNKTRLSLSGLATGTYFIQVETNKTTFTQKLIKQ